MDYVDKSDVEVFSMKLTLVIYQRENDDLVNDLIFSLCIQSLLFCRTSVIYDMRTVGTVGVMNPVATHHTAHHPWTTSPIMHCTHTFPSTITPITQLSPFTHHSDCLTTPAPHSLTHINAAHKHSPSAKSCFALATFLSVLPRICYLCV